MTELTLVNHRRTMWHFYNSSLLLERRLLAGVALWAALSLPLQARGSAP